MTNSRSWMESVFILFCPNLIHIVSLVCWTMRRGCGCIREGEYLSRLRTRTQFLSEDNLSSSGPATCSEPQSSSSQRVPVWGTDGEQVTEDKALCHMASFPLLSVLCKCDSQADVLDNVGNWPYGNGRRSHYDRAAQGSGLCSERTVGATV